MGLKTFVFSSVGPRVQPSSPPMESPPTQTRTGSDLLATHTLGGGVVGLGLGDAEAVWAGFAFVPPAFSSPFPRPTTTTAMITATTSTKTTSTRRRRRARWRRRRRLLVL